MLGKLDFNSKESIHDFVIQYNLIKSIANYIFIEKNKIARVRLRDDGIRNCLKYRDNFCHIN